MNALKDLSGLIALANSADGAALGFTPRHVAALKNIRIDVALAATVGSGIDAYRDLLAAASAAADAAGRTAPKHVRSRWIALRRLPTDAALRTAVLALAADLKRDDVLDDTWRVVLNDYTAVMDLTTGAYQPIDDDPAARRAVLTTLLTVHDDLPRRLTGLLEIAEYDGLAWSPETAQNLRDDLAYLQRLHDNDRQQVAPAAV